MLKEIPCTKKAGGGVTDHKRNEDVTELGITDINTRKCNQKLVYTRVYPKVSGLASWSENYK
jgi:hypothetical protein